MKSRMKRIVACLLCLSSLAFTGFLCSCGGNGDVSPVTAEPASVTTGGDISEEPAAVTTEEPYPLDEADLDDYEFLIYNTSLNLVTSIDDFAYEENADSILDNAIYRRNKEVEQKLNITISNIHESIGQTLSNAGYNKMLQMKASSDCDYDAVILPAYDQSALSLSSANYDLNHLGKLDLRNDWWDQSCVKSLEIKGLQFFTTGDFSIDNFNCTILVTFNKKLAGQYSLPDLYSLVNEGKWTLDKWKEYSQAVGNGDLNGDGLFTDKDIYGSIVWDDSIYGVVNAAGETCCKLDENGQMVLTLGTERVSNIFTDYTEFIFNTNYATRYQFTYDLAGNPKFEPASPLEWELFQNDQGIFLITWFGVTCKFRDMETDYGILPMFKYTEDQGSYYNTVAPYNSRFLSVPYHCPDDERTAAVLECIGYYSKKFVKPAYYEKMLYGAVIRDEESRPMLDLIHDTRVYDIGYYYQPADINKNLLYVFRDQGTVWSTRYASLEKAANKKLDRINSTFDKLSEEWGK